MISNFNLFESEIKFPIANSKKAKRLDIPADSFYGTQNPFLYDGEIYFVSNNKNDNFYGVNHYNPSSEVIKETSHLKESGRVQGFNIISN